MFGPLSRDVETLFQPCDETGSRRIFYNPAMAPFKLELRGAMDKDHIPPKLIETLLEAHALNVLGLLPSLLFSKIEA